MSERIKIRLLDYYTNVVGKAEYISVSKEVYEILEYTFRRETQAQYRHGSDQVRQPICKKYRRCKKSYSCRSIPRIKSSVTD